MDDLQAREFTSVRAFGNQRPPRVVVATASVTAQAHGDELRSHNGSPPRLDLPEKTPAPAFAKAGLNPEAA